MLLAERLRNVEEKRVIQDVLEKNLKVKLDENEIYSRLFSESNPKLLGKATESSSIVWNQSMRR